MLFIRLKVEINEDYVIEIKLCAKRLGFKACLIRMND